MDIDALRRMHKYYFDYPKHLGVNTKIVLTFGGQTNYFNIFDGIFKDTGHLSVDHLLQDSGKGFIIYV